MEEWFGQAVAVGLVCGAIFFALGLGMGDAEIKKQAIARNYAHYDKATTDFTWNDDNGSK